MGRELKRVPLDFDWPAGKTWKGYVNPHYEKCNPCDGSGYTVAAARLYDLVSLLMISGEDVADYRKGRGRCHPYFDVNIFYSSQGKVCGEDMAELTVALAGRPMSPFGHDACDRISAGQKIIEAAGLDPNKWGLCPHCSGHGVPNGKWELWESWERIHPHTGDGYQIWETVSEGSPISPVFDAPEGLANWMVNNEGGLFGDWMKFIKSGMSAPSFASGPNGIVTGVEYVAGLVGEGDDDV